jgi:hypothetical protein
MHLGCLVTVALSQQSIRHYQRQHKPTSYSLHWSGSGTSTGYYGLYTDLSEHLNKECTGGRASTVRQLKDVNSMFVMASKIDSL